MIVLSLFSKLLIRKTIIFFTSLERLYDKAIYCIAITRLKNLKWGMITCFMRRIWYFWPLENIILSVRYWWRIVLEMSDLINDSLIQRWPRFCVTRYQWLQVKKLSPKGKAVFFFPKTSFWYFSVARWTKTGLFC